MDARGGRATSGAARIENGQTFDRPEIKTDRVSNSQATGHLEQTRDGRDRAEGEEMSRLVRSSSDDRQTSRSDRVRVIAAAIGLLTGVFLALPTRVNAAEPDPGLTREQWHEHVREIKRRVQEEVAQRRLARREECERRGPPKIGMTPSELTASCWGQPIRVEKKTTAAGMEESYIYGIGHVVKLSNGKVSEIEGK